MRRQIQKELRCILEALTAPIIIVQSERVFFATIGTLIFLAFFSCGYFMGFAWYL